MHGEGPGLVIIAKKQLMADEGVDFDGDSYLQAKKKMIGESSDQGDEKYSDDPHTAMKQMAEELYKASKMHAGQADKLMEICEDMYEKEDKPHKAAGHNPHGKSSGLY
tara:strand:+ start:1616 stop:1939 length:324 start_codon:yes stop_codon:yes gene_type:complete